MLKKYGAYLFLVLIVIYHSYWIFTNAIDLPFWDEWESALSGDGVALGFSPDWIFKPHNEHIIAVSKFLMVCLYKINALNISSFIISSWLVYIFLVGVTWQLACRSFPKKEISFLVFYFVFLFSPIAYENHSWGFQICFHLTLLFQILALNISIFKKPSIANNFLAVALFLMSCYSLSIGVPMTIASILGLFLFDFYNSHIKAAISRMLYLSAPIVLGLVYWVIRFREVHTSTPLNKLISLDYWTFISSLVGLGYGFNDSHKIMWWMGLLPISLYLVGAIGLFKLGRLNKLTVDGTDKEKSKNWKSTDACYNIFWVIFGLDLLAAFATIALGRSHFGPKQALCSRYSEISLFWIPTSLVLFFCFLNATKIKLKPLLWALAVILFCGFADDWDFRFYRDIAKKKQTGLNCIRDFYQNKNAGFCESIYPFPMSNHLNGALRAHFSFINTIQPAPNEAK